jgi:hypothetical protein
MATHTTPPADTAAQQSEPRKRQPLRRIAVKAFDPTKPHYHNCPTCRKDVYCAGPNCEIPQRAECFECANGYTVQTLEGDPGFYRAAPQRFEGDAEIRRY